MLAITNGSSWDENEGGCLENALRRFRRKVLTEDIIKEVKGRSMRLEPGR